MRNSMATKIGLLAGTAILAVIGASAWSEHKLFPSVLGLLSSDTRLILTKTLFSVGGQPVRVLFLAKMLLFLVFLNLVSRLSRHVIRLIVGRNSNFGEHRQYILSRFISVLIYVVGIFIGINVESINLNTLVILGGTLGVGVGFGLQSLVSNLIAGVILLVEQPIRIGDRIEFGDKTGEVTRVGTRSSWIRTYDNAIFIIPNSEFVTKAILNWTASDPKVRITIPVSVAYRSDAGRVEQILLQLAHDHIHVMKEPQPSVVLAELGPSAMTFNLRIWTLTQANEFPKLRSDIYVRVVQRFREENIELPFPQLDLHLKQQETPA